MKKYARIFFVLAVALAVIGLARTGSVWAATFKPASAPVLYSPLIPASVLNAPMAASYTITANGQYNVGGVCLLDVTFNDPDGTKKLRIEADAEIPVDESSKVPFSGEGDLFFPGCHFVNYKQDVVVNPVSADDVTAKVCFGANPDFQETIYYYLDNPSSGSPAWAALTTTVENNGDLICANAPYTGVFMPAGKLSPRPGSDQPGANPLFPGGVGGSVLPPAPSISFSQSGSYPVGGVCIIRAEYIVTGLSDDVSVAYPAEDTLTVPFPESSDLLYFPGCRVVHYRGAVIKPEMNKSEKEGNWEICFAARPDKQMTIYYYQDDIGNVTPPWIALPTTTENGLACAKKVNFTAVYTPAGH